MKEVVSESINFINFNQDATCISVGTSRGYKIFSCDPFGKCYSRSISSIGIVEMLNVTSLLAVVGIGEAPSLSPRRLKMINTKKQSTICELTFPTTILSVKMNKERLVVVLEEQIYVYDVSTMKLLHTIETIANPQGLVALSPVISNNYLAYPSPPAPNKNSVSTNNNNQGVQPGNSSITSRAGDVIIFNTKTLQPYCVLEAHKATLAAISLSSDGLLLASASIKGTIIRVFSVVTGEKLYQFRRGTYGTKIYSLSFSNDNQFLTASSATETVHIFKLTDEFQVKNARSLSVGSSVKNESKSRSNSFKSTKTDDQNPDSAKIDSEDDHEEDDQEDDVDVEDVDEEDEENQNGDDNEDEVNEQEEIDDEITPLPSKTDESKQAPVIDQTRRSVGRLIRKSSQSLGRRAAETMGIYLPKRMTSVLKPIRHFASLKIPASNGTKSIVAINNHLNGEIPSSFLEKLKLAAPNLANDVENNSELIKNLVEVVVVTGNGLFLKYALDGQRGGDCILLSQYSLLDK